MITRYWDWVTERPESAVGDPLWVIVLLRVMVGLVTVFVGVLLVMFLLALGPLAIAMPFVVLAGAAVGRLVIR